MPILFADLPILFADSLLCPRAASYTERVQSDQGIMTLQARYTILRKIADGGTAEIFLATQHGAHGFEKPVVLKRIFPAFYADPQFRNMLIDEAHIAMSLNHSNIVQVLDLGEADGQYVLALDLVDGWTLDAVLRRTRALNTSIPPALALYMTAELCRALAYAHAKTGTDGKPLGIVHRDISPHNVLLSEQGEVKLTDFGIAKARNRRESSLGNIIKGKIAYMSPEQAAGGELDARSDLFSVGTLLYVMVCGRYPFDAPTDLEMLLLVKNGECVPPEQARPGLNPEIYRLLKRALAKTPADRYQRAEEMLVDFEQVMRIAFRAVGQTELKRWLQDLSMRDGVPPLTRAPSAASTGTAGAGRLEGETLELRGVGTTALPAPPANLPPPATTARPNRLPAPAPQSGSARSTGPTGRAGSATGKRPPPPPAAMAVGKKSAIPPQPPGPMHSLPHTPVPSNVVDPVAETAMPKPTAKPAAKPTANPIHASAKEPDEPVTQKVSTERETIENPATGEHVASNTGTERTAAKMAVIEPSPPTPRKSSSWVAEAVLAAAQRAGTTPPPPIATMVVPPPVILPAPHVTGDVRVPPAPPEPLRSPKTRRLVIGAGVGVAALLVIGLSMKTCGGKPNDSQVTSPGQTKNIVPPRTTSNAIAPPGVTPTAPAFAPQGRDAGIRAADVSVGPAAVATKPVGEQTAAADSGITDVSRMTDATGLSNPTEPETTISRPAATSASGASAGPDPENDAEGDGQATAPVPKVAVLLNSSPPGAEVGTPHHPFGTTPVSIKLKVGRTYALVFTRDGYRPVTKLIRVTGETGQELSATLRRAPSVQKPSSTPVTSQPEPPTPPKHAERTWFQRMFAR